ncbi:STAS domain-containing protein [Streptomyces sp. NPDC049915]|uniref:STAS domain-containing protein n=1 Tax=Streptomyces sp. NPDC049915 TaxID=3155510 RepID=UPI00342914F3
MSNTDTSPILTTPAEKAGAAQGADAAPGDILSLSCTTPDARTVKVVARGEADHFGLAPLRVLLTTAAVYGYRRLVLDCRHVTFCDSALLAAFDSWYAAGGRVVIQHPPPQLGLLQPLLRRFRPGPPTGAPGGRRAATAAGFLPGT